MTDKDNLPEPSCEIITCGSCGLPQMVKRSDYDDLMAALVAEMERADKAEELATRSTRRLVELAEPGFIGAFGARDAAIERAEQAERELAEERASVDRVIAAFDAANESGKITDTIWMLDGPETMYDAIRALKEQK